MKNKLGTYISKLMTTIIDKDVDEFVKELAWSELRTLNVSIEEFLRKYSIDDSKEQEKTEKQLLQEERKNVKNK